MTLLLAVGEAAGSEAHHFSATWLGLRAVALTHLPSFAPCTHTPALLQAARQAAAQKPASALSHTCTAGTAPQGKGSGQASL